MHFSDWISNNYIEVFGAVTGIIYVILEIRQNLWLWPVGIMTSAAYIWIFFTGKLYADMSLQMYYLVISVLGWIWWVGGMRRRKGEEEKGRSGEWESGTVGEGEHGSVGDEERVADRLNVTRIDRRTGMILSAVFVVLYFVMWFVLDRLTDSPVPEFDSFITSLSIIATWMLARKIFEHWYLWIIVNISAVILFFTRGLYPTVILYIVYCAMSFVGLIEWKKTIEKG